MQHINGSPAPAATSPDYSSWKKLDAIVLQWTYGTLSNDLFERVLVDESTTYEAWKRVENLFLNNKGSRAAALQHELTNLTLASMPSLEAYCQCIRKLTDQLAAADCPISNTQRIIHLVRGLPCEYDAIGSTLNQSLLAWENAVDQLQSEARRIAARDKISPIPVIAAAVTSQPHPQNRDSHNRRSSGTRRDTTRNNRKNTRGQTNPRSPSSSYQPQQTPYFPYWAPPPYWAPHCPYPTQGWAQPWQQRPLSNRPNT